MRTGSGRTLPSRPTADRQAISASNCSTPTSRLPKRTLPPGIYESLGDFVPAATFINGCAAGAGAIRYVDLAAGHRDQFSVNPRHRIVRQDDGC